MDKDWKNKRRKLVSACIAVFLVLNMLAHETVYASEELPATATGPALKVTTENADSNKSYDIKVEWGDMQFVYDYAIPRWNTETLEYSETGGEGWQASGFDGDNNKVQIQNRSNAEITVMLMVEVYDGVFNYENTENGVQAHFYDTNEHALQASKILTNLNEASFEGQITELILDSAEEVVDGEGAVIKPAGVRTAEAYFAFSGTPDKNLNSSTEVGSISLVFTDTSDIDD